MNRETVAKRIVELELMGVKDISEFLNWSAAKVATYHNRGYLPDPITNISGRPVWYKPEIEKTAEQNKWKTYENNEDYVDTVKAAEKERKELKKESVGA